MERASHEAFDLARFVKSEVGKAGRRPDAANNLEADRLR
jgi:hypothetical protein